MDRPFTRAAMLASLVLTAACAPALSAITIRSEKGGKVLLVVDDETVRKEAAGKPVLFIDGPKISTEKGGKLLFFMDGDLLHAYVPEGPVVGYKDGRQLRAAPGGPLTIYIDGPIIRNPDIHGTPIGWIDDHEVLNNQQLMSMLYVLHPEMIKMPAAPAASDSPAAAAPATPAPTTPAPAATAAPAGPAKPYKGGVYSLASFVSSDGTKHTGKITVTKMDDVYAMDLKFGEGAALQGVGFSQDNSELWAAIGPPATMGLAVYTITGGTLNGVWYNLGGDSHKFGLENLTGAADLGGAYRITSAKAPFTGATYGGNVTIDPIAQSSVGTDAPAYHLAWDLGGYKAQGVGFKSDKYLVAATSTGADYSVARFKIDQTNGTLVGTFYTLGKVSGTYTLKPDSN